MSETLRPHVSATMLAALLIGVPLATAWLLRRAAL